MKLDEPTNALDPQLEIFDSSGVAIPHGNVVGNEAFNLLAPASGRYVVRVFSEGAGGDYVLEVNGATGGAAPFLPDLVPQVATTAMFVLGLVGGITGLGLRRPIVLLGPRVARA